MKGEISKIIAKEYQERRIKNAQKTQNSIDAVYRLHPALQEIDRQLMQENASIAMQIIQDGLHRTDSERKRQLVGQREEYLRSNRVPADFDRPCHTCVACGDTGFLRGGQNEYCQCYHQLLIPLLLKNSNFKNLSKYNFPQFNLSCFSDEPDSKRYQSLDSPRKQMEGIRNAAGYFLDHFNEEGTRNLFFIGKPGTGKTFLSGCIANDLLMRGKSVLYLSAPELFENITEFRMLSNSFAPDPERFENAAQVYQYVLQCDLLILDDLGTETIHANRQPELLNILNHRMDSNKKMIISTNLDMQSLSAHYDERVLSRIDGGFSILRFFGDDLRHRIGREPRDKGQDSSH